MFSYTAGIVPGLVAAVLESALFPALVCYLDVVASFSACPV